MSEQNITVKRTVSNNWFLLKIALQEAPLYTLQELTTRARHRVIVFIEHIYMIGYIVNCIQYERPFTDVLWFVLAVFVGVTLVAQVLPNYVETRLKPLSLEKIHLRIRRELYRKAAQIDLKNYDDPAYYNEFVWAMGEAAERTEQVIGSCAVFIGEIVGILVTGAYVLTQDPLGLVLTGISVLAVLLLSNLYNKYRLQFQEKMKTLERKRDYISRVFYLPEYAKELRLSRLKPKLYEEFADTSRQLREIAAKETKRLAILSFCMNYCCSTFVFEGIYLIYLLFQAIVRGAIGYGTMVTLYNSCYSLRGCSQSLAWVLTQFPEHGRYIEKIRHFLECPAQICQDEKAEPVKGEFKELSLQKVSFSYPQGEQVLKEINLTIRRGEKIALVGYNGAGKTTLVKLLCGFYEPEEGGIYFNGINAAEFSRAQRYSLFSVVFQEVFFPPVRVDESIVLQKAACVDQDRLREALKKADMWDAFQEMGITLDQYRGNLKKGGVELSGGQDQRLLLARALYQDGGILVLDEPTAALDPIAESQVYDAYQKFSDGKTSVFISHRLASTGFSDRIVLLDRGKIVEMGSHQELMEKNGLYAEMFRIQSSYYQAEQEGTGA